MEMWRMMMARKKRRVGGMRKIVVARVGTCHNAREMGQGGMEMMSSSNLPT